MTGVATTAPSTPVMPRSATWRDLREASGMSLRMVEERSGINRGEISKIERGRSCATPDQARRLLATYEAGA